MQAPFLLQRALDSTARKGGHKNQNNIGAEIAKQRKSRELELHYRDKVGTRPQLARRAISRGGFGRRRVSLFAEGEADLGGAVLGVVVETGARDAGYADFSTRYWRRRVARISGILGCVEMEAGDVGHDE